MTTTRTTLLALLRDLRRRRARRSIQLVPAPVRIERPAGW